MLSSSRVISLLVLILAVPTGLNATEAAKPSADYSRESFVVEQFTSKQQFENDGTSTEENNSRVRIQSDVGAKRYGILAFSYASGTSSFELEYVRVRKPDGSVVETPPESVQDMTADITRQAPFYSDLREKHVAVKGLGVGDVLEYKTREHTTRPLAPGQFWTAYEFTKDSIILDEQFEVKIPRGRAVKLKSPLVQPVTSEIGEYRVYTWHNANLAAKDESNVKRLNVKHVWEQARGRVPQPDVLLSSFSNWEEVGRWYGALQEDRVKPTPEIKAKASELTRDASTDAAKVRALYNYVSTQFRYISISFGIGRYQPHGAAEVLANQYGDCKDKHTLLASLMASVGILAYPALISSSRELENEVPSPGQFDHVITVVPTSAGLVWLDTTTEVGPYEYLVSALRDKHALVIWKDKPPSLESTPVNLKYGPLETFNMTAQLNDEGTLQGETDFSARGDSEYIYRASFRMVPFPQWKDLAQRISQNNGFGGEVSNVTASFPGEDGGTLSPLLYIHA